MQSNDGYLYFSDRRDAVEYVTAAVSPHEADYDLDGIVADFFETGDFFGNGGYGYRCPCGYHEDTGFWETVQAHDVSGEA